MSTKLVKKYHYFRTNKGVIIQTPYWKRMKLIKPKQSLITTQRKNEANLKWEIRFRLRNLGFDVLSEYKFNESCTLDLVIIKNNEIFLIIEVKTKKNRSSSVLDQMSKYETFGPKCEIVYVFGWDELDSKIEYIFKLCGIKRDTAWD